MLVSHPEEDDSPDFPGFRRYTVNISRDRLPPIDVWFEVQDHYAKYVTRSGEPWLIAALPYAMETGENLHSEIPVDQFLIENLRGVIATWQQWYPWLKGTRISCPLTALSRDVATQLPNRTAVFFSSGVDSWFSILRHSPERDPNAIGRLDDLINIHGFDIPLDAVAAYESMRNKLLRGAHLIDRELITVRTNLRQKGTLWHRGWGWLTHAAGLAAVGHILNGWISRVVVGSTFSYGHLEPWGSHPMVDPLFSSTKLAVSHDGAVFNRAEKTEYLMRHPDVLPLLHVCWKQGDERNCGRCPKCFRTMAALKALDAEVLDELFDEPFTLAQLSSHYVPDDHEHMWMSEVRTLAESHGRTEVAAAVEHSLSASRRIRPLMSLAGRMRRWPYLWRHQKTVERVLLRTLS